MEFKKRFWEVNQSVVLEGLCGGWQALQLWGSWEWLREEHGHRYVPIEIGSSSCSMREELVTLAAFIDSYLIPSSLSHSPASPSGEQPAGAGGREVAYLAQHRLFDQIPQLREHFQVPPHCACGQMSNVNAWLGTAHTVTNLHFDSYDNLFCQVVGSKYVRLYNSQQTPFLYPKQAASRTDVNAQGNVSAVDVRSPDLEQFPLFESASYTHAVLHEGDSLFIPAGCWHYVESLTTSFSINFWF